jgi:hypothetical protein
MLVWQNQAIEKCAKYGAGPSLPKSFQTAGVSLDLFGGAWPINGLRHKPEGSASGWFFWSGAVWSFLLRCIFLISLTGNQKSSNISAFPPAGDFYLTKKLKTFGLILSY